MDNCDWFDQLRDPNINEDLSSVHWNVSSLYNCDPPPDVEERARARKIPSLSDLQAELVDLMNELQSLEADADEEEKDITDEDSSSTEVSSLSSLDLSEKEYRNRSVKLIDQLKNKNDQVVQSLGVILNSHPSKITPDASQDATYSNSVQLPPEVINAASNLMSAVESVKQITQSLKNLPLDD